MNKVELICISAPNEEVTGCKTASELISYCARVSNPGNQHNAETSPKLIGYLLRNKHFSPFEMVSLTMSIETTRDISRQILRHRSFSFQEFCVEENTLITTITKSGSIRKVKIKDLYKRYNNTQYYNLSDNLIRIYDQSSKTLKSAKIKEVFKTGIKPVFELTLENNKKIQCTNEHKVLTLSGFKRLKDIDINTDFIATNGIPLYQNKEWLQHAKHLAITTGGGLNAIANMAECKPVTISTWLRKYKIQFTKQEVASYTTVWNKGLPKEHQPNYGRFLTLDTRNKMRASSRKGPDSNLYTNGNSSFNTLPWRQKVAQWCKGYHNELMQKQNNLCNITNEPISYNTSEVDHIIPVFQRPDLAFDVNNLQIISKQAHRNKTTQEILLCKQTISYNKIKSIIFIGDRETYDIEVEHDDHNYVANGIITHNSQRYAVSENFITNREARLQDSKNRQNSIEINDERLQNIWNMEQDIVVKAAKRAYEWALENGIAKEQARSVLPEGLTGTTLYMAGSLRSWIHYCTLRTEKGTQKEHRLIADQCMAIINKEFPDLPLGVS